MTEEMEHGEERLQAAPRAALPGWGAREREPGSRWRPGHPRGGLGLTGGAWLAGGLWMAANAEKRMGRGRSAELTGSSGHDAPSVGCVRGTQCPPSHFFPALALTLTTGNAVT